MPIAQVLLDKICLRYCQVIWSGSGAEILKQTLSVSCISNSEKDTQEQVAWLEISSKIERSTEQLAAVLQDW